MIKIILTITIISVVVFFYICMKNRKEYVELATGTVFILKDIILSTTGTFYKLQSTENGEIKLILKEKVNYWYRKVEDYDK